MLRAKCPDCGTMVELEENIQVGSRVVCVDCGLEFEILSLGPLTLDYVLEDDWDENWDQGADADYDEDLDDQDLDDGEWA